MSTYVSITRVVYHPDGSVEKTPEVLEWQDFRELFPTHTLKELKNLPYGTILEDTLDECVVLNEVWTERRKPHTNR